MKPLRVGFIKDVENRVRGILAKLLVSQNRWKEYKGCKVWGHGISSWRASSFEGATYKGIMRFGKKDKLSPCYIGPFKIPDCVGPMAYK